jgi:AraC-like DNA-binding protein
MTVDRAYRSDGLTLAALAQRLAVPEYRLRRHINQHLGFRNFNTYVNSFRLADARRWLADPTQRDAPVLTLALDAGFGSIGPFNRAFKADTGLTPTEFRNRALADSSNR